MNTALPKVYIKNRLDEYLLCKGINIKKPFRCLNPLHEDVNPSMSYDGKRKKAHCFSCGADYDTFDLIAIDFGIQDNAGIFRKAYEYFGVLPDDVGEAKKETITEYIAKSNREVNKTDYFQKRGLSDVVIKRFRLGYDDKYDRGTGGQVWKAVIIPTGKDSFTARNINPQADKLNRIRKQGKNCVFNTDNGLDRFISDTEPLFVVEGELDAMSVIEAGGNAVALGSVTNWKRFHNLLVERFFFKGCFKFPWDKNSVVPKTVIIALDNDKEGRCVSSKLLEALSGVFGRCLELDISLGYKDPNEALMHNREAFIRGIRNAIDTYSDEIDDNVVGENALSEGFEVEEANDEYARLSAAFHLEMFKKERGGLSTTISTGFPQLDTALCGFKNVLRQEFVGSADGRLDCESVCESGSNLASGSLFPGLYILGAISSLGKTTFIVQMADNIAASGLDVIIFSLEMSKYELMAKSVSRHTLIEGIKNGFTDRARTAADIMRGVAASGDTMVISALDAYAVYAGRIYINEFITDVADIRCAVERHVSATGRTPVIFVDYIQILGNRSVRGTDKQLMDRNITELKRISRDFKTPVIGVSSFNRQSYREAVTMESFKESGAIEYSSDVLIGLQLSGAGKKDFDADREKMKNPRSVELKVLKNRNGRAGEVVSFSYYPEFNYFKEV